MPNANEQRVVPMRPRLEDIQATVRRLAEEDRRVYLSNHAKERMDLRSITRIDVIRVLRRGHVDGEVVAGQSPGEWKCKVVANVRGSRDIGVVTLIIGGDKLLVKTVEWEDL